MRRLIISEFRWRRRDISCVLLVASVYDASSRQARTTGSLLPPPKREREREKRAFLVPEIRIILLELVGSCERALPSIRYRRPKQEVSIIRRHPRG